MNAPRHILVLTYWSFNDALIRTYTLPYLRIILDILPEGSTIHLLTLERANDTTEETVIEKGISHFSFPLLPFGIKAALQWRKNIAFLENFVRTKNIDTIHTWCTPAGGIGYRLSKKTDVPLVLDSFEPHAEAMVETGTWKRGGPAFRMLFRMEKKQTHHADWRIGVTASMREYAKEKYGWTGEHFLVKPACIDLAQFNLSKRKNPNLLRALKLENKIVCVYAGKFGGLYLKEEVFTFFRKAFDRWGEKFHVLLLTSARRDEIDPLCIEAGIDPVNVTRVFVQHEEVPSYLGLGDFAISPFKPVPSRKCCTPIKNGEYWAMGLPVVIPKGISDDSDIIASSGTGVVLEDLSPGTMEDAIKKIEQLLEKNKNGELSEKIHALAVKHRNFNIAETAYRKIYGQ